MSADLEKLFIFIATFAGLGAFVDFFLGKQRQKRFRGQLETWWILLADVKLRNFARQEALFAYEILVKLFGTFLSWKRLRCLIELIIISSAIWTYHSIMGTFAPYIWVQEENIKVLAVSRLIIIIPIFWISTSFTIWIAKLISQRLSNNATQNLLIFILLIVLQIFILAILSSAIEFLLGGYFAAMTIGVNPARLLIGALTKISENANSIYAILLGLISLTDIYPGIWGLIFYISGFVGFYPALMRIFIAILFILSYLLKPAHGFILTFLERSAESDKPIFTLLFAGTAGIIKFFYGIASL